MSLLLSAWLETAWGCPKEKVYGGRMGRGRGTPGILCRGFGEGELFWMSRTSARLDLKFVVARCCAAMDSSSHEFLQFSIRKRSFLFCRLVGNT